MPDIWYPRDAVVRQAPLFDLLVSVDEVPGDGLAPQWREGITTPPVSNQGVDSVEFNDTRSGDTVINDKTVEVDTTDLAVGMVVAGTGIPAGARISTITDSDTLELNVEATANGTGVSLTFSVWHATRGEGDKWVPFTLRTSIIETTDGFPVESYSERAIEAYSLGVSEGLARELWLGELKPANPYLAKSGAGTVNLTPGGGIGVVAGIDKISAALTISGRNRPGMIFVAPETFERYVSLSLRGAVQGGKYRLLPFGHILVSDAGFPGTGIAGATTSGKQWVFATDPILLERSPIRVTPTDFRSAVDRAMNTVVYSVEQDCVFRHLPHRRYAIEVTL